MVKYCQGRTQNGTLCARTVKGRKKYCHSHRQKRRSSQVGGMRSVDECWNLLKEVNFIHELENNYPVCHQMLSQDRSLWGQLYQWMYWWHDYRFRHRSNPNIPDIQGNDLNRFLSDPIAYHNQTIQRFGANLEPNQPILTINPGRRATPRRPPPSAPGQPQRSSLRRSAGSPPLTPTGSPETSPRGPPSRPLMRRQPNFSSSRPPSRHPPSAPRQVTRRLSFGPSTPAQQLFQRFLSGDIEKLDNAVAALSAEGKQQFEALMLTLPDKFPQVCGDQIDFISQTPFSEYESEESNQVVRIKFQGDRKFTCYDRAGLLNWFQQRETVVADWVPKPGERMDDMGYGGHPGKHLFMRLYTPGRILTAQSAQQIMDNPNQVRFRGVLRATNQRIGNLEGNFSVSGVHGQVPGESVYELQPIQTRQPTNRSPSSAQQAVKSLPGYYEVNRAEAERMVYSDRAILRPSTKAGFHTITYLFNMKPLHSLVKIEMDKNLYSYIIDGEVFTHDTYLKMLAGLGLRPYTPYHGQLPTRV